MLIWLSFMLFPVIAGGVVGIVMQRRQIRQTRATSERIGTTFLTIERAHRALHAAEVAATERAQAPGEPAADAALWAAEGRAAGALADLEAITPTEHLAPVRQPAPSGVARTPWRARRACAPPATASCAISTPWSSPPRASSRPSPTSPPAACATATRAPATTTPRRSRS
jgi:hypothetical protein